MRSLEYAHEKLWATVLILAEENGAVQERFARAYVGPLSRLTRDDFPLDLRVPFIRLAARMDDPEARSIVEAIVAMYGEICKGVGTLRQSATCGVGMVGMLRRRNVFTVCRVQVPRRCWG